MKKSLWLVSLFSFPLFVYADVATPFVDDFESGYSGWFVTSSQSPLVATSTDTHVGSGAVYVTPDTRARVHKTGTPLAEGQAVVYWKASNPNFVYTTNVLFQVCQGGDDNGFCSGSGSSAVAVGASPLGFAQNVWHSISIAWRNGTTTPNKEFCYLYNTLATSSCSWIVSANPNTDTYGTVALGSQNAVPPSEDLRFDDVNVFPVTPTTTPYCTPGDLNPPAGGCNSNVMFLPGIESSKMYDNVSGSENKIWPPIQNSDINSLDMTNQASANTVYVKDGGILLTAYGTFSVYSPFAHDMDVLKSSAKIVDWKPIAYDWRLDYEDLLTHGNQIGDKIYYRGINAATSTPYIIQELKRLASTSRTGKVTIVAHSNGGLLAKTLLLRPEYTQYVDKLILVAVPQLGTPVAVGGLLHGFNQEIPLAAVPIFLNDVEARNLATSSPFTYSLLPSAHYFSYTSDPVITFNPEAQPAWYSAYGGSINNQAKLNQFITDPSRPVPAFSDTGSPSIGDATLINNATAVHNNVDSWIPPANIKVVAIAGWGQETLAGIEYSKKISGCGVFTLTGCILPSYSNEITLNPRLVVDGDGTVIESSALWGNGAPITRYWINLYPNGFTHANILGVPSLRTLLDSLLTNSESSLPLNVSISRPSYALSGERLHFILHSPLTLGFQDVNGVYTGGTATSSMVGNSNVRYERFGEVQWISVPKNLVGNVVMRGTGSGTFTLDVKDVDGNMTVGTTTFAVVPTSTSTIATLFVDGVTSPTASSTLNVDYDGNGSIDTVLTAQRGAIIVPPIPPKPILTATADNKTIITGAALPQFTASISGYSSSTPNDVTGAPIRTTTATATSSVGLYPITCTMGTLSSSNCQFAFATGTFAIMYRCDGFGEPLNSRGREVGHHKNQRGERKHAKHNRSIFKSGSTIPVKFTFRDAYNRIITATTSPLWLTPERGSSLNTPINESLYAEPQDTGAAYQNAGNAYRYAWKTKGIAPGFWYRLYAKLGSGQVCGVTVGVK